MFTDAEIYAEIFEKPHPNMITDLLTLSYYYKTFQRKAIAHPENFGFDDEDHIPAIQNGERYYLACISFLAKVKSQVFAIPVVKRERAKGDENLRMLLWKCGDMEKIIKADGNYPEKLNAIFDTDEGARYVGEFSFGVNPYITKPMGDILFDEKISGSIHFTPGCCYDDCYNGNISSIHWDLVFIQTPEYGGGDIYIDGELIRHDGRFVPKDLQCLNPENLK